MCSIPGALILSFEPGLNAHAGIYAQRINTWSELKMVVKELKKTEVMEKFKTVCFDTVEQAAQLCQDYVCARAGVQALGDKEFGKLYKEYELEFSRTIRSISMLGYGCVFACHTEVKEIPGNKPDVTIERLQPKLDRRAFDIINGLVDIIGIGVMEFDDEGHQKRTLYTSETPTVRAGNRFTYFPPKIEFSYQAVLDSLTAAIEAEGKNNNATIVDEAVPDKYEKPNFLVIRQQASELWSELVAKDEANAEVIMKKVEMIFNKKIDKLSQITEDQAELFALVVEEMKDMLVNY